MGVKKITKEEAIKYLEAVGGKGIIDRDSNGIMQTVSENGKNFSHGERQIICFARALAFNPKILILDEATSSIDTRTEALIQKAFNKLMVGRTSFIIAHRLSTIQNADIILVLVDGDIVEHGSHQDLMQAKGMYYQMQTAQGSLAI